MSDKIVGKWHVIPEDPDRPHEHSEDCWCGPEEDEEEPGLWVHNDTYECPGCSNCEPGFGSARMH